MNLNICFNSEIEFKKAVDFVANDSEFYAEDNQEWNMLVVECCDEDDANINEKAIEKELIEKGIESFYFEIED